MMYRTLAAYYDALVKDEAATAQWVAYVKRYIPQSDRKRLLEAACGSGEITLALARCGYRMQAGDISMDMLHQAQAKANARLVEWHCFDMRNLSGFDCFDGILCFCDSLNYLLKQADVRKFFCEAYAHLLSGGVLLFDMHSLDRLDEFAQEYCEVGNIDDTAYEWTINCEDDYLYQTFAFYDKEAHVSLEQHIQRVYDPKWVMDTLMEIGFRVEVCTDFEQSGIAAGEKYFYACIKQQ